MNNKGKIILSIVGVVLSIALLVVSTILAEEKIINPATLVILIAVSAGLVLIAIFLYFDLQPAAVDSCR